MGQTVGVGAGAALQLGGGPPYPVRAARKGDGTDEGNAPSATGYNSPSRLLAPVPHVLNAARLRSTN